MVDLRCLILLRASCWCCGMYLGHKCLGSILQWSLNRSKIQLEGFDAGIKTNILLSILMSFRQGIWLTTSLDYFIFICINLQGSIFWPKNPYILSPTQISAMLNSFPFFADTIRISTLVKLSISCCNLVRWTQNFQTVYQILLGVKKLISSSRKLRLTEKGPSFYTYSS